MANLKTYRLDSEFQILGNWFLKDEKIDEALKGTLYYSQQKIELELYDSFGDVIDREYEDLEYIYGFSSDGKTVILHNLSFSGGG